jgi:hypothetical protein
MKLDLILCGDVMKVWSFWREDVLRALLPPQATGKRGCLIAADTNGVET